MESIRTLKEQDKIIKAYMEDKIIGQHNEHMVEILLKCPTSAMVLHDDGSYSPAMSSEIKHLVEQLILSRDIYIAKNYGDLFKKHEKI